MSDLTEQYIQQAYKLYHAGQRADALAQLRAVLAISPRLPAVWLQIGILLIEEFQTHGAERHLLEAREALQTALRERPDWEEAQQWLSIALSTHL
jgi:tetratricopeptide (TPR) repeat protein